MVIVTQDGNRIVKNYIVISPCRDFKDFIVKAHIEIAMGVNLGKYASNERCEEVIQEIVNAYKEGLPVFEMPKE